VTRRAPIYVGGFIVAALALGIAVVVVLGSGRLFRAAVPFVAYFRGSVEGLEPGAPVKVRGLVVGSVRAIYLNLSRKPKQPGDVRMPVVIELEPKKFTARGVTVDLENAATMDRIIREFGLRARLSTPSLITGGRHVVLDLLPETPFELVGDVTVPYREIPTAPSDLEGVQRQALDVLDRISRLDFERLFGSAQHVLDSAQHVLDGADRVVSGPDMQAMLGAIKQAADNLRDATANLNGGIADVRRIANGLEPRAAELATQLTAVSKTAGQLVDRAQGLVDDTRRLVPPGGTLVTSAQRALLELTDALRSLRQLADQLQRDPGAILRGTP